MEHRENGHVRCIVYNESRTRKLQFNAAVPQEGRVVGLLKIWPGEPRLRRLDPYGGETYEQDEDSKVPLN
ncbi:uncharacterized protein N7484_010179 [Penicillium longicatenatum]|uniref:uncharacterized protein n=1 Tax=Penicillium longicatenatum TaxID=1561947 RepID=UPI00254942A3|nr:uncharacterized protein N7484_010179 [Penicillium longicatenatum]KAJ5636866.1 hypothetical protein N7484_010179 [Penicillium longicatenatum]